MNNIQYTSTRYQWGLIAGVVWQRISVAAGMRELHDWWMWEKSRLIIRQTMLWKHTGQMQPLLNTCLLLVASSSPHPLGGLLHHSWVFLILRLLCSDHIYTARHPPLSSAMAGEMDSEHPQIDPRILIFLLYMVILQELVSGWMEYKKLACKPKKKAGPVWSSRWVPAQL